MPEIDRRTLVRTALAGAGLAFAGTAGAQETETETGTETADDGLVTVESDEDFEATVERISSAVEDSENLTLVATVDHAENAESADLELPPTTVLMFGNPRLGTQLMRDTQSAGIDLPQKMLVWEAEDGTVNVTYNDPEWVAERHGVEAPEMAVERISQALESLATGE